MGKRISRRDLLKTSVAAGMSSLVPVGSQIASDSTDLKNERALGASNVDSSVSVSDGSIVPLTCTSGVYIPPRGDSFFKFSFDFPEPCVAYQQMQFSFRLYTFENAYGLDRDSMKIEHAPDGLRMRCSQFVWAGGQEKVPGNLLAQFRKIGSAVQWSVSAEMDRPIKSVAAIVRGVPRGKVAGGSGGFFDPADNELLFGYPFGAGDHHTAQGIDSPLVVVQSAQQEFFFLSTLLQQVRACRVYLQPGADGYRAELVYEQEGWDRNNRLQGPIWRAGRASTAEAACRTHFEHVADAFHIPMWEQRQDVPSWFRDISLVISMHGMHWTGYVFNDFAKAPSILDWVATQIPPHKVMVFLPAWDGRYYWDYPVYRPEPRLGGEDGFRALMEEGHRLGFRFLPMFGMNAADDHLEAFAKFADATTQQVDGNNFDLDWVDWDNDRHNEGTGKYMNLGVQSWNDWLFARIADIVQRFEVDGYFLDISGGWVNNTKADMHEGTRRLVKRLREKFPLALAVGEFSYDALMSILPVYQVFPSWGYPAAFQKYARSFDHLSFPAPGRGSSGVHESGFGRFRPNVRQDQPVIPTITVVDDTFEKYRDEMAQVIGQAKKWTGMDWNG